MATQVERIPSTVMRDLQDYHWPGNIRELRNTVERAMLTSTGPTLTITPPGDCESQCHDSESMPLEEMEKNHILKVLATTGGKVKGNGGAAQILRINPSTLFSRMRRLGIRPLH
jgi:transcriptional regulator of acetoin/glycerol metabolism